MRILHVVSSLDAAGVPSVIMGYLRAGSLDEAEVDFIVHGPGVGVHEAEVVARGSKVFHVTPRKNSLVANLRQIWSVISKGNYDVVHSHLNFSSVFPLCIAKAAGVPMRISHSHGSFEAVGLLQKLWFSVAQKLLPELATDLFSCSDESGTWLFGERWTQSTENKFLMKNAVDLRQLQAYAGRPPRDFPTLPVGTRVLFTAGRLSAEKNHKFLLEVVSELSHVKRDFRLYIAGDGPLRGELQNEIERRRLEDFVTLLGQRADVASWLGVTDINLLPSIREGLPMILIEAQAISVRSIVSTGVPEEANVTGSVEFVPLIAREWVMRIVSSWGGENGNHLPKLIAGGYDIHSAAPSYAEYLRRRLRLLGYKSL